MCKFYGGSSDCGPAPPRLQIDVPPKVCTFFPLQHTHFSLGSDSIHQTTALTGYLCSKPREPVPRNRSLNLAIFLHQSPTLGLVTSEGLLSRPGAVPAHTRRCSGAALLAPSVPSGSGDATGVAAGDRRRVTARRDATSHGARRLQATPTRSCVSAPHIETSVCNSGVQRDCGPEVTTQTWLRSRGNMIDLARSDQQRPKSGRSRDFFLRGGGRPASRCARTTFTTCFWVTADRDVCVLPVA